jgi:hypothetical protein
MTSEDDLWPIVNYLDDVSHSKVVPPTAVRGLRPVDRRSYEAGVHGAPGKRHEPTG